MPKKSSDEKYSCDILTEYDTAANEEVQQEIEIMVNTFDGVRVSGKNKSRKKLVIPIVAESNPARKVVLEITIVQGYPYLPPHVRLVMPSGMNPGDKNALSEYEIAQMRKEVTENIQPCLSSGMPSLMQITSTVASIVDNGCSAPQTPSASAGASSATPAGARKASPGASPTPGQSPALTPVPLKAKDALRLSLLTLHLLRKCCHLTNPESRVEASSNFEWLAHYLLGPAHVFPPAVQAALPWRGEPFARAFAKELQQTAQQALEPVHPAADVNRTDLTKWLWESEELPVKLQQGTEGRYQNEFIQQRLLGSGGFAPVYVCRKKIDGRLYAIKKVVIADGQSEKIIREVQTLAALNHKNIVRYYDAWVEDGCEEELKQFLDDGDDEDEEDEDEKRAEDGSEASDSDSSDSSTDTEENDDDDDDLDANGRGHDPRAKKTGHKKGGRVVRKRRTKPAVAADGVRRDRFGMIWQSSSSSSSTSSSATSSSSSESSDYEEEEENECSSGSDSVSGDDDSCVARKYNNCGKPPAHGRQAVATTATKEPGRRGSKVKSQAYQTLYIQMELCSAHSLRHLIDESDAQGSQSIFGSENGEKVAAAILRQLLTVTAHTHRENIVHRDLKPDNVLFEMNSDYEDGEIGTIRVADFGLARVMDGVRRNPSHLELTDVAPSPLAATTAGAPTGKLGSVLYCAPEQERGSNYGFKVDEFSVGMIALEMWLAIAGKGFRERFNIMNEVWRSGKLPEWFIRWNPSMAEVTGSLLELDQQRRCSCEEVLATADLPGDPADIIDVLETLDRYGERIVPRVMQKMQKLSNQYRKPPPTVRDSAQLLASIPCTDFNQAVGLVGLLHGSASVALYDSLLLMNPALSEVGVECVVDGAGRGYGYSSWPQFAVAAFLGMQESLAIGAFHTFYRKTRSYAVFATPMKRSDILNEMLLEPILSLLHLLTFADVTSRVEIVISHADWLNTVIPKEVGDRLPPQQLRELRAVIDSSEKVSLAVSHVSEVLEEHGLPCVEERDDLLRRFASAVVEVVALFGRAIASHVVVVVDPAMEPSDSLVNRSCLDKGILFECHAGSHAACPIAFGCAIDNFTPRCTVLCPEAAGFCVVVDAEEFVACWKHFRMPGKEGVLLDGVAVKRHDQYSLTQLPSVVEAAIELWKGGIKAALRVDSDPHILARVLKAKHLRHILVDGKRIVSAATAHQNKMVSKQPDIPVDQLQHTLRALAHEDRSNQSQNTETGVVFVTGREDKRIAEEAREVFSSMEDQVKGPILIMQADSSDVERYLRDLNDNAEPQGGGAPLLQWMKANMPTLGVVPIFAVKDSKMLLYVNQKKFRVQRKKDLANSNNSKRKK